MGVNAQVVNHIDIPFCMKLVTEDSFWKFAANEWHKMISPFTPMDTGNLFRNVTIRPGEIEYNAPYATTVYNRHRNYSKDLHPLATEGWDAAAAAAGKDRDLIRSMQGYIDSGRLKLA